MKQLKILRQKMELFDLFQQDDEVGVALKEVERTLKRKKLNIAFGEEICRALEENDFQKVVKCINSNNGDIVGYDSKANIIEILEHAVGSGDYCIVPKATLKKINKLLNKK